MSDFPTAVTDAVHTEEYQRRFAGVARLYGDVALQQFEQTHVMIIGLGGVGSWAAESLARTAIGHMTLVDMDILVPSNVNRQLPALTSTFGIEKTQVMASRLREINPFIKIDIIDDFIKADNIKTYLNQYKPDIILDCIDDVPAKLALILHCRFNKQKLIVAGSAGGKLDPLNIRVNDLTHVEYDPMLAKIRNQLKQQYNIKPKLREKFNILCVYSVEQPYRPAQRVNTGLQCGGYGSATTVTASFGMVMAAQCLKKMMKTKPVP